MEEAGVSQVQEPNQVYVGVVKLVAIGGSLVAIYRGRLTCYISIEGGEVAVCPAQVERGV